MFPLTVDLPGGGKCEIREADPDDAAGLIEYVNAVSGESDFLTFGPGEFRVSEDQERDFLLKCRDSDRDVFLLAIVDGELAGTLHFGAGTRQRTRHAGELGMSVRRALWGRGIGGALLDALLGWASEGGRLGRVNLKVRVDNYTALALYRSRGFEIEGTLRDQIRLGGESFDLHVMGRGADLVRPREETA